MATDFASKSVIYSYGSAGGVQAGYGGATDCFMITMPDSSYAVKGNQQAYFDINCYKQGRYTMIEWRVLYIADSSGPITQSGCISGTSAETFDRFGVQWLDYANRATVRTSLCVAKLEVHGDPA